MYLNLFSGGGSLKGIFPLDFRQEAEEHPAVQVESPKTNVFGQTPQATNAPSAICTYSGIKKVI